MQAETKAREAAEGLAQQYKQKDRKQRSPEPEQPKHYFSVQKSCGEHLTWTFNPNTNAPVFAGFGKMDDY